MLKTKNWNQIEYGKCAKVLPVKLKCCLNLILTEIEAGPVKSWQTKCKSTKEIGKNTY